MSTVATLNVRLPEDLKERGMQVLDREGVSVSALVRALFRELESTQQLPDFVHAGEDERSAVVGKRAALREFVRLGRALEDAGDLADPRDAYREHLLHKHRPGVRA